MIVMVKPQHVNFMWLKRSKAIFPWSGLSVYENDCGVISEQIWGEKAHA